MRRLLGALFLVAAPALGTEYHVGPNGVSTSPCTANVAPWCNKSFAQNPGSKPDDIIWMHEGVYQYPVMSGTERYWRGNGTVGHPLTIRAYVAPGTFIADRVTIQADGSHGAGTCAAPLDVNNYATMFVSGHDTIYWGLEVTASNNANRVSACPGSAPPDLNYGDAIKMLTNIGITHSNIAFVNCIIHDARQGIVPQNGVGGDSANGLTLDGDLIYYNGHSAPDRGHGHGIYSQMQQTDSATYRNTILERNACNGWQGFGSSDVYNNNITFDRNIMMGNSDIPEVGGGCHEFISSGTNPAFNQTFTLNFFGSGVGGAGGDVFLGQSNWLTTCGVPCITGDVFTGNYLFTGFSTLNITHPAGITIGGAGALANKIIYNSFSGWTTADHPLNTFSTPKSAYAGATVYQVNPSTYEPGRGTMWIHCPTCTAGATVAVDLSPVLAVNDTYQIRYSLDYYGTPIKTGTYAGGTVAIPMDGYSPSDPAGNWTTPVTYAPKLGAFVILKTGIASTPTPTNTNTFTPTQTATVTKTSTPTQTLTPNATASATPAGTATPTQTPVVGGCTYIQAPTGTLSGNFTSASDVNAFGGSYAAAAVSPVSPTDTATYSFSPGAGTWYFSHAVLSPTSLNDSFYLSYDGAADDTHIDDTAEGTWSQAWQKTLMRDRAVGGTCAGPAPGSDPVVCQFKVVIADSNAHTLRLRGRDVLTKINWIGICPDARVPDDPPPPVGNTATNTATVTKTSTPTPTGTLVPTNTPTITKTPTITQTPGGIRTKHKHFCNGHMYWHSHANPHENHPCPYAPGT